MSAIWLPEATKIDLSGHRGYGPFQEQFLGVVAHCNQSIGNLANFFSTNVGTICPTFQVYLDGSIEQYLPLDWQPVCQSAGNQQYGAIETEGYGVAVAGHAATAWTDAQLTSLAYILGNYNSQLGMPLELANVPGQPGFGWHGMGGVAWGGHPSCPGDLRKAQMQTVLDLIGDDMTLEQWTYIQGMNSKLDDLETGTNQLLLAVEALQSQIKLIPPPSGGVSGPLTVSLTGTAVAAPAVPA